VTEQIETSSSESPPTDSPAGSEQASASSQSGLAERAAALADERPEVAAGAAFAGGFLLAMILKRLAR
jgi:hypothetical protein